MTPVEKGSKRQAVGAAREDSQPLQPCAKEKDKDIELSEGSNAPQPITAARLIELDEERCAAYASRPETAPKKSKVEVVDAAVVDFVNADVRIGLGCRRKVPKLVFRVDNLGKLCSRQRVHGLSSTFPVHDHHDCRPDLLGGCPRCGPQESEYCCDCCNPEAFKALFSALLPLPAPAAYTQSSKPLGKRSSVRKYNMAPEEIALMEALLDWRDGQAATVLMRADLIDFGLGVFISDFTISRIVDCVHGGKLSTISSREDVLRETKSAPASQYASDILHIVSSLRRPTLPPPTRPPLQPQGSIQNVPADTYAVSLQVSSRRKSKCSICLKAGLSGDGHNGTLLMPAQPHHLMTSISLARNIACPVKVSARQREAASSATTSIGSASKENISQVS